MHIQAYKKSILALLITVMGLSTILSFTRPSSTQAAFPGLNGRVAIHSSRDGDNEIYTMKTDGSSIQQLTNNLFVDNFPAWSPDGTKIAFVTNRDGNNEIYTMNADGTNQTNVTNNTASDTRPSWSPDGDKLLFHTTRDGNNEIYNIGSDGSNPVNLTNNTASDSSPSWSPDGTRIAFTSNRDGNNEIYTIDADGTDPTNITNNPASDAHPDWSPDSSKLLFTSDRDGNSEVYNMSADGSGQANTSNNAALDIYASWSPDGTKVIFRTDRDGNDEIYLADSDGSNLNRLTDNIFHDSAPSIQPLTIAPATIDTSPTIDATSGSAVYDTLANHTDTYEEIDPSSVAITSQPSHGDVSVNSSTGDITYAAETMASSSFINKLGNIFFPKVHAQSSIQDSFTYQVCSTANALLCSSATVSVDLANSVTGSEANGLAETGASILVPVLFSSSLIWLGAYVIRNRRVIQ